MYDVGLADRIRAKGVTVVEVAGWQTRGNSSGFAPRGALHHHTAGAATGAAPSLAICIYGRTDVPGPLAQVLQSREPNPAADKAYVIAAGKANHGGVGYWMGMDSNYESEGLEVEHTGMTSVDPARHEISARILAAMCEAPGSSRSPAMVCEHFEYALPPGRKIDFRYLSPYDANWIRARAGFWIGRTVTTPTEEDDDMPYILAHPNGGIYLIDNNMLHLGSPATVTAYQNAGIKTVSGLNQSDADNILANADRQRRMELYLANLSAVETAEATRLPAPSDLSAQDLGDGRVKLSWTPVAGAVKYAVRADLDDFSTGNVSYETGLELISGPWVDAAGKDVTFQISAVDAVGNEGEQATVTYVGPSVLG